MSSNRRPTALIADDEAFLAADLKILVEAAWPELQIIGVCHDGIDALEFIEANRPEVAFLDIRMPGMSGLEVAAQMDYPCQVVFITAYDQYAVQAFEHAAVDYLLKPIDEARLARTIERLRSTVLLRADAAQLEQAATDPAQVGLGTAHSGQVPLRWIRAAVGDEVQLVSVEDVRYFQALDKYTMVVLEAKQLLIRKSIRELLSQLDPGQFWQIHRGSIVNLKFVKTARQDENGHLSLSLLGGEQRLAVSRAFAAKFKQM